MPKKTRHPHVAWRNGRPRFQPSATLRLAGHAGKDLRHDDGRWFTFEEAVTWSEQFCSSLGEVSEHAAPLGKPVTGYYVRGFVYFLWAGEAIKVGFSKDPFSRVASLRTSISDPVRMVFAVPGTLGDEKRLHRRLRSQRLRGEWFKASTATLLVLRMVLNESSGINGEQ